MVTRVLTRNNRGMLKWRLDEMEIGDELIVPRELATYGKTYNYAKSRASVLEMHVTIKHTPDGGSVVKRTATAERHRQTPEWVRPKPLGVPCDWGVLKKREGQRNWRWPFDVMEIGDEFRVASEDYPVASLRKRAYTYNWFNKTHLQVLDSPAIAPGYTLVRRNAEARVQHDRTSWSVVQQRVLDCYETDDADFAVDGSWDKRFKLDYVPWFDLLELGNRVSVPARKIAEPHRSSYIFELPTPDTGDLGRFALDLYEDHITVERVELDMTHELWEEVKKSRIDKALE